MKDDRKNKDDAELTPLQRYLAKQKADAASSGVEPTNRAEASTRAERQRAAREAEQVEESNDPREEMKAVPKEPPPPPPSSAELPRTPLAAEGEPGGFFSRFLALMIDTIIVFGISLPIRGFMAFTLWFLPFGAGDASVGSMSLGSFLAMQIVTFLYYGWFYSEKGATPGKMLFSLQVRSVPGGGRPSYLTSYLRESLGKYISSLILGIGFFVALFRADRRALHDLAFGTQVVVKRGE